jgi:hypothetical protein
MSPTETLRTALAAYDPARPRWQQQRAFNALRTATNALAATIHEWEGPDGKLERWWREVDAVNGQPGYEAKEAQWIERNGRYVEARDLLGEALAVMKQKGVG